MDVIHLLNSYPPKDMGSCDFLKFRENCWWCLGNSNCARENHRYNGRL